MACGSALFLPKLAWEHAFRTEISLWAFVHRQEVAERSRRSIIDERNDRRQAGRGKLTIKMVAINARRKQT